MRARIAWALAAAVPLAFLAVFFAWPVATLVARGLVEDGRLTLAGLADVFSQPRTLRIVGQTLALAAAGTAALAMSSANLRRRWSRSSRLG